MSEFEDWLRKGLGRAAVHLMTHDRKPYREAIVHACTYNLAYDRQCEETRPQYLIDLIQLSRDEDFYRDAILDAIRTAQQVEEDDHDNRFAIGQIYGIATHFAKQDEEIRRAMYATFQRLGFANAGLECAEQLIKLDGVPGLVSASETVDQIDADERPWMFGEMLKTLDQHHGKHPLPHTLIPFAAEREAYQARPRSPGTPRMSYAEVKARVLAQGRKAGMLLWTKRATDEEVRCLAEAEAALPNLAPKS